MMRTTPARRATVRGAEVVAAAVPFMLNLAAGVARAGAGEVLAELTGDEASGWLPTNTTSNSGSRG